jgi:hypothetical protein
MRMKTFAEFWTGMFFCVSTATVSVFLYLVLTKWQPLWTEGFRNFGDISKAIMHLDETARPVAEMAPLMLGEMDEMRKSMLKIQQSMRAIEEINPNVKDMTFTMNRMTWVMDQRMGMMNNNVDRVGDKLSPPGMMLPFNW